MATTREPQTYEALCSSIASELVVPDNYNFVTDTFERWRSDRLCILWEGEGGETRRFSWNDLADDVDRVANVLRNHGVGPGDRVFIQIGRRIEWWQVMLASMKIGAVSIPGTVMLTPRDIAYRMKLSEPVAVVTESQYAARFDEVRGSSTSVGAFLSVGPTPNDRWIDFEAERDSASGGAVAAHTRANDPAVLFFTSGTTGLAKMVVHSQSSYGIGHTVTARYWLGLSPEDLHWNISDTGWAKAAWSSLFSPFIAGAAQVIHAPSGAFSPTEILDVLAAHPITSMCAAPTIFRSLVLEDLTKWRFPHLESCVAAGEPLNPEVIETWRRATDIVIRDGYGQTETCCIVANFPGLPVKPGSMGKPAPSYEISIVGDDGVPVKPDREGDIGIRISPTRPIGLFLEYWKNPEANAASTRGDYYITGDRGVMDADGYLWFVGRADDVILSAGYRIGPFEVESALLEHPAVAESAVVSSPDRIRGEVVKAFVVLKPGVVGSESLKSSIQEHVKATTAPYKYPRKVEFVPSLPKTTSGKIRRIELRNQEWGRPTVSRVTVAPDGSPIEVFDRSE